MEGAGGLLVPLNEHELVADLIMKLNCKVILVSRNYLGSINHSLLTIDALKNSGVEIIGLVFCGEEVTSTREYILRYSGLPLLFTIPHFDNLDPAIVCCFAASLSFTLKKRIHDYCSTR